MPDRNSCIGLLGFLKAGRKNQEKHPEKLKYNSNNEIMKCDLKRIVSNAECFMNVIVFRKIFIDFAYCGNFACLLESQRKERQPAYSAG